MTTGRLSDVVFKSFLRHICDLQGSSINAIEQILSTSLVEGTRRPTGDYPDHWVDYWHEEDGGDDSRGVRPHLGVTILQQEMGGLSHKEGCEVAWDDVTNAELIPNLVKQAWQVEMGSSRSWVSTTVPRWPSSSNVW